MARTFNGTTDLVNADGAAVFKPVSSAVACSMAAWVLGATSAGTIYADGSTVNQGWAMLCGTSPDQSKLRIFVQDNGGTTKVNSTGTLVAFEAGVWHHVAFCLDGSRNFTSYVDGVLDVSGGPYATGTFTATVAHSRIGVLTRSGNGNFYAGAIAEVATWTRTLSSDEATQLASGKYASDLSPDYYWPLAGIASPEPDLGTAVAVNGALTGTGAMTGPPLIGRPTFIPSLGRRPVPMIQGPDKDNILGMRGNSY